MTKPKERRKGRLLFLICFFVVLPVIFRIFTNLHLPGRGQWLPRETSALWLPMNSKRLQSSFQQLSEQGALTGSTWMISPGAFLACSDVFSFMVFHKTFYFPEDQNSITSTSSMFRSITYQALETTTWMTNTIVS